MANKENQSPLPNRAVFSKLSPNNKPALSSQRDHSSCRNPDTPLKVRKTRENLRQPIVYADVPPPCIHAHGCSDPDATSFSSSTTFDRIISLPPNEAPSTPRGGVLPALVEEPYSTQPASLMTPTSASRMQRQKSVSRRVLSRVKQGIGGRSRSSQSVRPTESESSFVRRLSERRRPSHETEKRAHSFEVARGSVDSSIDETPASSSFMPSTVQQSFTGSTVLTTEVFEDRSSGNTLDLAHFYDGPASSSLSPIQSSSPSPSQTPRPPPKRELPPTPHTVPLPIQIPSVDLYVALSSGAVDLQSKHDIWVAIEATVRPMPTTINIDPARLRADHVDAGAALGPSPLADSEDGPDACTTARNVCEAIPSLRLCFKPMGGCTVHETVGQKTCRDLRIGQQCSIFVKLHIPRVRIRDSAVDASSDSLFAELESMVGTLKMEVLHVEARYRHHMLPSDNVVTVRHVCKVKRPKAESRWSLSGGGNELGPSLDVHVQIAQHLASNYSAEDALELLRRHIDHTVQRSPAVRQIRDTLLEKLQVRHQYRSEDATPSVVVTDSDLNVAAPHKQGPDSCLTTLTTPAETSYCSESSHGRKRTERRRDQSPSRIPLSSPPTLLSSARTTTSVIEPTNIDPLAVSTRKEAGLVRSDSARQLWRHIRRTSSSAKQLEEMTAKQSITGQLESHDETVDELYRRALANKRSVGAETLRAWKWDESMNQDHKLPPAPWI